MRKYIAIVLSALLLVSQGTMIFAADDITNENYEMVEIEDDAMLNGTGVSEISPYTLYLADVITSIVKVSSSQVSIRAQAICSQKVQSITVIYTLQKWNGSKWADVASRTATAYDAYSAHKTYSITGLGSGSYRCKASAKATGYNGYSETLTGYSASITI